MGSFTQELAAKEAAVQPKYDTTVLPGYMQGLAARTIKQDVMPPGRLTMEQQLATLTPEQRALALQDLAAENELRARLGNGMARELVPNQGRLPLEMGVGADEMIVNTPGFNQGMPRTGGQY